MNGYRRAQQEREDAGARFRDALEANDVQQQAIHLQRLQEANDLRRSAFSADVWSRLLYTMGNLVAPISLPDAVENLAAFGSNGALGHQSSVCLWNTERILQALLLLMGNNDIQGPGTVVQLQFPTPLEPAKVVPTKDAEVRMRLRVGYQLRKLVYKHYCTLDYRKTDVFVDLDNFTRVLQNRAANHPDADGPVGQTRSALEANTQIDLDAYVPEDGASSDSSFDLLNDDASTGARFGDRYRLRSATAEAWLEWTYASVDDLLDYADNIPKWEEELLSTGWDAGALSPERRRLATLRRELVLAAADRYRNIRRATVQYDEWARATQDLNVRNAELCNRDLRTQFVYSVTMACALFRRAVGFVPRIQFEEMPDAPVNVLPDLRPEQQVLEGILRLPVLSDVFHEEHESYNRIFLKQLSVAGAAGRAFDAFNADFAGVDEEWTATVADYDNLFPNNPARAAFVNDVVARTREVMFRYFELSVATPALPPPLQPINLPPRKRLQSILKRVYLAATEHTEFVAASRPHTGALALSEMCLVMASATGSRRLNANVPNNHAFHVLRDTQH